MKFNVDSHFVIGKNHIRQSKPCQDHALCELMKDGTALAIVSDGCSTGRHTDIGSRLITTAGIKTLKRERYHEVDMAYMPHTVPDHILSAVNAVKYELDQTDKDLLATCAYSYISHEGGYVQLIGDGCFAIKFLDGGLNIIQLDWQNNMPLYAIYRTSNLEGFIAEHMKWDDGRLALKVTEHFVDPTGEITSGERFMDIKQAIKGYSRPVQPMAEVSVMGIFSDGVQDFQQNGERLSVVEVIKELMSFKNFEGEFVKRRLSMALKNYAKKDIYPFDDVSMAATYFNHAKPATENE